MRLAYRAVAVLASFAVLGGCPEDPVATDTGADAQAEVTTDISQPDAEVGAETTPEVSEEVTAEVSPDIAEEIDAPADILGDDGPTDIGPDTLPDGTTPDGETVDDATTETDAETDGETIEDVGTETGGPCIDDDKSYPADQVETSPATSLATDFSGEYTGLQLCTANADDLYEDWFKFDTTEAGNYVFSVAYTAGPACFDVAVYSAPGGEFLDGSPDLTGSGQNAATLSLDAATTYYIQVYALDAAEGCDSALTSISAGPYSLDVTLAEPCEDDAIGVPLPDDPAIATLASGVATPDLSLCAPGDEDYFAFELPADGDIVITVDHTGAPGAEFDIYLYNQPDPDEANIVDEAYDESGTGINTLTSTQPAGTYYVNVYAFGGSGNYTLTVEASLPECAPECANGGLCVADDTCDCAGTGFEGPTCEVPITCTPECANGGVCVATDTCDCAGTGFDGPTCEVPITCTPECANGGVCVATDTCDCTGTGFFGATCESLAPTVWINEIHYDNDAGDADEGVEIAATAGTDLEGWTLVLYNGSSSVLASYGTEPLTGTVANQAGGFGTLWFPINGLQNGGGEASASPDGLALVDPDGTVIEFLSYEGTFTPSDGPAAGMESVDIGVAETGTTPAGQSLQLTGTGSGAADFTWSGPVEHTRGEINAGQSFP